MDLIEEIFSYDEVATVKRIPIILSNCLDKLIWRCTRNGRFIFKSAYHLQDGILDRAKGQSSNTSCKEEVW